MKWFISTELLFEHVDAFLKSLSKHASKTEEDFMSNAVPGEACYRTCQEGNVRVCHFKFNLEYYQVLGG